MKWELHPQQAALSRALYVIRLRHGSFQSAGRWINKPLSLRVYNVRNELGRLKPSKWHSKSWQPPEGRESPREVLMGDRRSSIRYEYAGAMRHLHGKAPPLIGRSRLYDPFAPREAYRHPIYDREAKAGTTDRQPPLREDLPSPKASTSNEG